MIFHQPTNSLGNYNHNLRFYTNENWDFHFHKNLELICVEEGSVKCTVNNTAHILQAGMLGLCLPYDVHAYRPAPGSRYWVLVFSEDFVRYFAKVVQGKTAQTFAFRCNRCVYQLLEQTFLQGQVASICSKKACLYAVCGVFLEVAARLLEEIDKKMVEIAFESGFQSVRSFNGCFRSHFGVSPSEYKRGYHGFSDRCTVP